ncbi:hypothetical protein O181_097828 [Austropuccinia psidii MF-1]|uniref:Uncharacterized protein n=1 Tax=Austropuccinia psidii MF-1 TaxID=1389203 RepID=A0A9Q3J844_9BASI|nr:hypothetical protein [Austropuccinia psidii MF-1]
MLKHLSGDAADRSNCKILVVLVVKVQLSVLTFELSTWLDSPYLQGESPELKVVIMETGWTKLDFSRFRTSQGNLVIHMALCLPVEPWPVHKVYGGMPQYMNDQTTTKVYGVLS